VDDLPAVVIFGHEDSFLNMFARLARVAPVVALASPKARFQPVYVGDVAHCFVRSINDEITFGGRYDLCGPKVYTLQELMATSARSRVPSARS
jgi:NADH dehydrogenase